MSNIGTQVRMIHDGGCYFEDGGIARAAGDITIALDGVEYALARRVEVRVMPWDLAIKDSCYEGPAFEDWTITAPVGHEIVVVVDEPTPGLEGNSIIITLRPIGQE